MINQWR